jgi:hypothetical protein
MALKEDRTVGRPGDSVSIQARDVTVGKDKPRINDERKVRPHSAGSPPMGVRPNHPGAQKEPKAPSDKLGGEYIQAREVPMQSIHEAELEEGDVKIVHNRLLGGHFVVRGPHHAPLYGPFKSRQEAKDHLVKQQADRDNKTRRVTEEELTEWNPFERFFKSRQPGVIPGDAVGYQITRDGIDIVLVKDGRPVAHKRVDSHEAISQKMQGLQQELAQLQQQRRGLSINPRKIATQAAWDFAAEKGIRPMKIGELNREVPVLMGGQGGAQAQPAAQPAAPQAAPAPAARRPTPAPAAPTPKPKGWGHRGEPMQNMRSEWQRRSGQSAPAAASPAAPAAKPSMMDQLLSQAKPEYYTPARLAAMTDLNKQQAIAKMKMGAGGMKEGYPDKDIADKGTNPAHQSRIGNLGWVGRQKEPKAPAVNKEFMAPREVPVAKVTEWADEEMDEMISKTVKRLGFSEGTLQGSEVSDMGWGKHASWQPGGHSEPPGLHPSRGGIPPDMGGTDGPAQQHGPEVDHVTLPAYWASALVNGDDSGLDDDESDQMNMMVHQLAQDGWHVVDVARDESGEGQEPRFTNSYQVHNPHSQYRSGDVLDYVVHRDRNHGMKQSGMGESAIPRTRKRWL